MDYTKLEVTNKNIKFVENMSIWDRLRDREARNTWLSAARFHRLAKTRRPSHDAAKIISEYKDAEHNAAASGNRKLLTILEFVGEMPQSTSIQV